MITQREMRSAAVNAEDFLKIFLNVGDFTREFKCGQYIINTRDCRPVMGNGNVWPEIDNLS